MSQKVATCKNMTGLSSESGGSFPTAGGYYIRWSTLGPPLGNDELLVTGPGIGLVNSGVGGTATLTNTAPEEDKSADGLMRWVMKLGNDADAGSRTHPKLTVASANTSLLAAVPAPTFGGSGKVDIGPGLFSGVLPVILDVAYNGTAKTATLCEGLSIAAGGPSLTSINNINFINVSPMIIDTSLVTGGGIFLFDIDAFSSDTIIADCLDSTTQMFFLMCVFGTTSLTINGCNNLIIGQSVVSVPVIFNSSATTPHTAQFPSTSISGTVDINYTSGHQPMVIDLSGVTSCGQVTITGTGVCAPGSVSLRMPLNYSGTPIVSGTAGFCVIQDTNNSASALVSANGTAKASLFAAAPGLASQCLMNDGLGGLFWDYVRNWFTVTLGGANVSWVTDPSDITTVGNVAQITSANNIAIQPLSITSLRTSVSQDYYLWTDSVSFDLTYSTSGGNLSTPIPSFSGANYSTKEFDPLGIVFPQANIFGQAGFNLVTPYNRKVRVEFMASLRSNVPAADPGLIYITLNYNGTGAGELLRIKGAYLPLENSIPVYGSQIIDVDFSVGSPTLQLFVEVTGSDNLPHNISFDQAKVNYLVLAE